MAKAPLPGTVKTRLAPLLGHHGCAALQAELIRHTAAWVAQASDRTAVAYAPVRATDAITRLVPPGVELFAQHGANLGARMRSASARAAAGWAPASALALIGTDAPLLGPGNLLAAFAALAQADACVIPAHDGGYVLIALATPAAAPFDLPPTAWGGPQVLELTLGALARAGLSTAVLPAVADLDTPADALALRSDPNCPASLRALLA